MEYLFGIGRVALSLAQLGWGAFDRSRIKPEEVLAAREKWEGPFRSEVYRSWREKLSRDICVRDLSKLKKYPELPEHELPWEKRRPSPWFESALIQADSDGFLICSDFRYGIRVAEDRVCELASNEPLDGAVRLFRAAHVPYEHVVDVKWDGDNYTNKPVVTCKRWGKLGPATTSAFYEEVQFFPDMPPTYIEFCSTEEFRPMLRKSDISSR